VESVHPGVELDALREATGFPITVDERTPRTPPPSPDELTALAEIDPVRVIESEF